MNKKTNKKENKEKILGYIRVSTDNQDIINQELEIRRYCDLHNLKVHDWIKVEISSRKDSIDRRIDELLKRLKEENFTTLIVTEASRLSRTIGELLYLFEKVEKDLGIEIIETKEPELNKLPAEYKLMRRIFAGYFAQQERNIISLRTKEALRSKKQMGIKLGKKEGTIQSSIYDDKKKDILFMLEKKLPITSISKFIGIGKVQSLRVYLERRGFLHKEKKSIRKSRAKHL